MRITIIDNTELLNSQSLESIANRVESTFSKFGDIIKSVEIFVEDINGPKGGIDKQARIKIDLKRMKNVFVSSESSSVRKAISQSVNRAGRAVARSIQRRHYTHRRTGVGLAYESNDRGVFSE